VIVHLNGWPGVGKQTIGRTLAALLRARFIHNHLLHDVAIVCAGYGDSDRWPLYEKVRAAAYAALARRPAGELFVMTNGLCVNSARERDAWARVVALAVRRDVPLIPVVLHADTDEICRRVESGERQGRKMTDPADLRAMIASDTLQCPDVPELFVIDVTSLSADDAAAAISRHVSALRATLRPASERHLRLRT
jgi:gluconate kinase